MLLFRDLHSASDFSLMPPTLTAKIVKEYTPKPTLNWRQSIQTPCAELIGNRLAAMAREAAASFHHSLG